MPSRKCVSLYSFSYGHVSLWDIRAAYDGYRQFPSYTHMAPGIWILCGSRIFNYIFLSHTPTNKGKVVHIFAKLEYYYRIGPSNRDCYIGKHKSMSYYLAYVCISMCKVLFNTCRVLFVQSVWFIGHNEIIP